MRYLPHTAEDITSMLASIGVTCLDDLFSSVPEVCKRQTQCHLPSPLNEWDLSQLLTDMNGDMAGSQGFRVFLGAGSYPHYIPAVVPYLLSRSEFTTAYTPYQPEISQGTLQAIYEYQTCISRLLGMEVANASLYDGASALAEALLMALRITKKHTVAVSTAIHPHYRQVVNTYLHHAGFRAMEIPYAADGRTDISMLMKSLTEKDLGAVAVQSPNFFGCIEEINKMSRLAHEKNALFVTCITEPLSLGLYNSPGVLGADIACGEGQSLGIPQSFGGPGLGLFACRQKFMRQMPGRLVGQTVDEDGHRGFVLTLATREQHIRREKATSNICTNNNLCALSAVIYLASLGGTGFMELARINYNKTEYLKTKLKQAGFRIPFGRATFNEFVAECPEGFHSTYNDLIKNKTIPGLSLEIHYPDLSNHYLFCVTEVHTRQDLDQLAKAVQG